MPLVGNETTEPIALTTPGEWVKLKRRLSRGDQSDIDKRILRSINIDPNDLPAMQGRGGPELIAMLVGHGMSVADLIDEYTWGTLYIALAEWSFYEGKPRVEDIRSLTPEDFDIITAAANDLYPGARTADDEKKSLTDGAPSSAPEAGESRENSTG